MTLRPPTDLTRLHGQLQRDGFAFVQAPVMRDWMQAPTLPDWAALADSWNRLAPDTYLAAQGRYRRRRHAVFSASTTGELQREPHQPHFQSLQYNRLHGDIQRWFDPIEPAIADGASMRRVLAFCCDLFGSLVPTVRGWRIEVHQFRIEARGDLAGQPTPEGVHRDGVDYVLVLLVNRQNVASGTTSIHLADGTELGSFTLTHPFDAALVDDARVFHGVTAVTPLDPGQPAHRDVLVVTLKALAGREPRQ